MRMTSSGILKAREVQNHPIRQSSKTMKKAMPPVGLSTPHSTGEEEEVHLREAHSMSAAIGRPGPETIITTNTRLLLRSFNTPGFLMHHSFPRKAQPEAPTTTTTRSYLTSTSPTTPPPPPPHRRQRAISRPPTTKAMAQGPPATHPESQEQQAAQPPATAPTT